jgi:hypothetical protein
MKKTIIGFFVMFLTSISYAQQAYDSTSLVDTNNNSTTTSTVTSNNTNVNTNNNVNDTIVNSTSVNTNNNNNVSTSTNVNQNINTGDMTNRNINTTTSNNLNINETTSTNTNVNVNQSSSTNTNINQSTSTNRNVNESVSSNVNRNTNENVSTSVNTNVNQSSSDSTQRIDSVNRNDNYNRSDVNQRVTSPPPTAIAPSMMSGGNSDLCTTGVSGAVQTQILGLSRGATVRDMNCERLKLAKTLFDMGMKVAAVSTLCQDRRIFDSMWAAGTPCPYEGKIGEQARILWEQNPDKMPQPEKKGLDEILKGFTWGLGLSLIFFLLL